MKKQFVLTGKKEIAEGIYHLTLMGDTSDIVKAGQFVNIAPQGCYLRRPISVCDVTDGILSLVISATGVGTRAICQLSLGSVCDMLTGLGNGFTLLDHTHCVLVGGGVGVPPLFLLAKQLLRKGIVPEIILGFRSAKQVILAQQFRDLSLYVTVCTEDGSEGRKGTVCDVLSQTDADYIYACGPKGMLCALAKQCGDRIGGQFLTEERMGCGVGICMGCTCQTKKGAKLVCTDGPVFDIKELKW